MGLLCGSDDCYRAKNLDEIRASIIHCQPDPGLLCERIQDREADLVGSALQPL